MSLSKKRRQMEYEQRLSSIRIKGHGVVSDCLTIQLQERPREPHPSNNKLHKLAGRWKVQFG